MSVSGLVVIQTVRTGDGTVSVTTALLHTSNEWISDDLVLRPAKFDAQGCGAASTYARRYSYQSILNIAGEVDDDGNAASGKTSKKGVDIGEAEEQFQERTGGQRAPIALVNAFQELFLKCGKTEKQLTDILRARWSADRPDQLTKQELDELLKWAVGKEPLQETLNTSVTVAQERQTVAETPDRATNLKYVLLKVSKAEYVTKGKPRWVITGSDNFNQVWTAACWDKNLGQRLHDEGVGRVCSVGISEKTEDGKTYTNIKAIEEIAGRRSAADPGPITDEDIPF